MQASEGWEAGPPSTVLAQVWQGHTFRPHVSSFICKAQVAETVTNIETANKYNLGGAPGQWELHSASARGLAAILGGEPVLTA